MATAACSSGRYFQFDNSSASAAYSTNKSVAVAPAIETTTATTAPVAPDTAVEQEISASLSANTATVASTSNASKHATTFTLTPKQQQRIAKRLPALERQFSKQAAKHTAPAASLSAEGKSQIVALVLVLLVGGLGIHRFYLGYTGIGIVQLLTAGGCGIWALIDLVRIITGDLKPKDGDYAKKL
ncbi:TM2 domain-containing protein [Hymenobacter rubidus]|uniref:TM2 domain-containing protein n=1 Tax=Hymenobacter rubidus TaxID=1441626 RepID=UPI00191D2E03|nr:NINE protein [Hymenobacter rubidus]